MQTFICSNHINLNMTSDFLKVLSDIERKSMKSSKEIAYYIYDDGNILFSTNGSKKDVRPNKSQLKKLKEVGDDIMITHNHPKPYDSPLTKEDLKFAIYNNTNGVRAVTKDYTYVALQPTEHSWRCSYQQFNDLYDKTLEDVKKSLNKKYKTHNRVYYEKLWHETMARVCKKLGIKYYKISN